MGEIAVLYLSNSPKVGGGNISLLDLMDGIRKYGIRPYVVIPDEGPYMAKCKERGIEVIVKDLIPPDLKKLKRTLTDQWSILNFVRQKKIRLFHSNSLYKFASIGYIAKLCRIPTVCHVQYPSSPEELKWLLLLKPKPTAFIHNSLNTYRQREMELKKLTPRSIHEVIYNGVVLEPYLVQGGESHEDELENLEKESEKKIIAIVANLIPVKGHTDFLRIIARLNLMEFNIEGWIIGEDIHYGGRKKEELVELSKKLGINHKIKFLGFRDDIPQLMKEIDILVSCSYEEPFGIVLIEAGASGKPVVATRVGGIPEVIKDGETGFLVQPGEIDEFCEKIILLLRNPRLRKIMGDKAKERVVTIFSMEKHVERIYKLYKCLLNLS